VLGDNLRRPSSGSVRPGRERSYTVAIETSAKRPATRFEIRDSRSVDHVPGRWAPAVCSSGSDQKEDAKKMLREREHPWVDKGAPITAEWHGQVRRRGGGPHQRYKTNGKRSLKTITCDTNKHLKPIFGGSSQTSIKQRHSLACCARRRRLGASKPRSTRADRREADVYAGRQTRQCHDGASLIRRGEIRAGGILRHGSVSEPEGITFAGPHARRAEEFA